MAETKPKRAFAAGLFRLAACVLILAVGAVSQSGKLFGRDVRSLLSAATSKQGVDADVAPKVSGMSSAVRRDGAALVVDSSTLAPSVTGYGGPVPVEVRIENGVVRSVSPILPNDESPMFFGLLEEDGLWTAWDGLPPAAAATAQVDAVTSATYSSSAAIANARAAFAEAASVELGEAVGSQVSVPAFSWPARSAAAVAVLAVAAFVPLFSKSRRLRTVLLWLDVAVLGLWSGAFISTARLLGWVASGPPMAIPELSAEILLWAMALLWPLAGRPAHYCAYACPFGAAQELSARLPARKWKLPPRLVRVLSSVRMWLWAVLTLSLWIGLGAKWLEWELFGAFAWRAAPAAVVAAAIGCVALSAFVPRPYCRFVCPTGAFLKLASRRR